MARSLALLLSTGLLLGGAASPPGTGARSDLGPILVKVVSVTPKPMFNGNMIEHWRHYRFRIVGTTNSQLVRLEDMPDRYVDAFDRRDVPPPREGGGHSVPPACPGTGPGEQLYVVQLEKVRARKLIDGVRYVLDSCLTYNAGSAYGFALFDDG